MVKKEESCSQKKNINQKPVEYVEKTYEKHKVDLDKTNEDLRIMLKELRIKGEVKSRFKRKFSIFKKQQSK